MILPEPGEPAERAKKHSGPQNLHLPPPGRQKQRFERKLEDLQAAFEEMRLQPQAAGIAPEEVLVLETIGAVSDFFNAVSAAGLELLGEIEEEDIPADEDFYETDKKGEARPEKLLNGRLLLVFSNQQSLTNVLSIWRQWQAGERLQYGLGKWKEIFGHLKDIRPWSVTERLKDTDILVDWKLRLANNEQIIPCEIELWYRQNPAAREAAESRVQALVEAQNGRVVSMTVIPEIAYHAILVELPDGAVREIIENGNQDIDLIKAGQIQYFRATGQMAGVVSGGDTFTDAVAVATEEVINPDPVVALFDGMPLQGHQRLNGHLIIDDPDNFESSYQAHERLHGTAMASLILHGDLEANGGALARRLYVRPIFTPSRHPWEADKFYETVPEGVLVVDLLHRAILRLVENNGAEPAAAPSVRVVNLSIGIRDRMFSASLSPLARLIDWLAWKYNLLFVISAGNHAHALTLDITKQEFDLLGDAEKQKAILMAVRDDAANRRLLSPAESVNSLTVGATHVDGTNGGIPPHHFDPFIEGGLPSPINAQGMGYRRAIKPEILTSGGRIAYTDRLGTHPTAIFNVFDGTRPPGQKVASPGTTAGDISSSIYIRGTSNAAALTSRSASILYEILQELKAEPNGNLIDTVPDAVWLKTLLVHTAKWGSAFEVLKQSLENERNRRKIREYLTRFLGYGSIDLQGIDCSTRRVTALGGGSLGVNKSHIHRFPLPPSLSSQRVLRRLTITLTWLTPVNPSHKSWRRASLWFDREDPLSVDRQEADARAVTRGTVQHEIFEGEKAAAFVDGSNLEIKVSAKGDAGVFDDEIPYALAITLEVGADLDIDIYNEIRERIHAPRIEVTP
ncbi:MAG: S8 family peptidase [Nitrospirota bacterium]